MKIDKQVCSLEQSMKLKMLGVAQESYWHYWFADGELEEKLEWFGAYGVGAYKESVSAFSVAELGVMLPRNFTSFYCGLEMWRIGHCFHYAGKNTTTNMFGNTYEGRIETAAWVVKQSEAEARAEMLIHLLEKGYLVVDAVNAQLLHSEQKAQECDATDAD